MNTDALAEQLTQAAHSIGFALNHIRTAHAGTDRVAEELVLFRLFEPLRDMQRTLERLAADRQPQERPTP